jgi:hypothetical protein
LTAKCFSQVWEVLSSSVELSPFLLQRELFQCYQSDGNLNAQGQFNTCSLTSSIKRTQGPSFLARSNRARNVFYQNWGGPTQTKRRCKAETLLLV